jgi:ArsR family transcriptional regulator, arsenate/arsenite/antimonite-responsive transcriptional repressor
MSIFFEVHVSNNKMELADLQGLGAAFSETGRIRILHLLLERKYVCVTDLQRVLDISQSLCSQHLKMMMEQGMVAKKVVGLLRYYHITEASRHVINNLLAETKDSILRNDLDNYDRMSNNFELKGQAYEELRYII